MNNKNKLKDEHLIFFKDDMYLPYYYLIKPTETPVYKGRGNHSVKELEDIIDQFLKYAHEQAVIKNNCMKHIVELKFNLVITDEEIKNKLRKHTIKNKINSIS